MKTYQRWNLILGWFIFLIAAITYLLTIEPTVSWWDCGEFIASSYKLQVGHPPGAPLFLMMGRMFSLLASDPEHVAKMINAMSGLASAFTILFLFWTITHLVRKLVITGRGILQPEKSDHYFRKRRRGIPGLHLVRQFLVFRR